ncbi:MAG: glycerol-3-phosphate 1-O-acyltransferase [Rhodospirillaceae bacterium]|nr:glycerol-3-phosphate 1-O-acyltransferase [Rhodospirillaceae bacterium]
MPHLMGGLSFTWPFYAATLIGYLVGAIPFGLILTRLAGLGDLRQIGSGNIGATNVLRTGNKSIALLTLILDGGKGALAVTIADQWGPDMAIMAGGGVFIGHLLPVWLRFKGGKGVATALGVLLALDWPVGALSALTWLIVALAFRYSSLAALIAMALAPVFAWWWTNDLQRLEFTLFIAIAVWLKHVGNIRRLVTGAESKISLGGARNNTKEASR